MRIVKEHEERKNEIVDTAARLFAQKGYDECSVNDILNTIGIAKGTFYHYFRSKEEVLDAVISRATDLIRERINQAMQNTELAPTEKMLHLFLAMRVKDQMGDELLEEMHRPENALLHQKSLVASVEMITPMMTQIVEEGNAMGIFHCRYPEQDMRIFLTSIMTLMDDGIFQVPPEKQQMLLKALITMLEMMLGVETDSILKIVLKYWK